MAELYLTFGELWSWTKAVFMTVSDLALGAGMTYLAACLFETGRLGQPEMEAIGLVVGIYAMNRVVVFIHLIGRPVLAKEPGPRFQDSVPPSPGWPQQSSFDAQRPDPCGLSPDTTTRQGGPSL